MKKIKSREEFTTQLTQELSESMLNEDVEVDICVEEDADKMVATIQGMDGVKKTEATDFGVVKATVARKIIDALKRLVGVESVQEVKKGNHAADHVTSNSGVSAKRPV